MNNQTDMPGQRLPYIHLKTNIAILSSDQAYQNTILQSQDKDQEGLATISLWISISVRPSNNINKIPQLRPERFPPLNPFWSTY